MSGDEDVLLVVSDETVRRSAEIPANDTTATLDRAGIKYAVEGDTIRIIDGRHRVRAMQEAGLLPGMRSAKKHSDLPAAPFKGNRRQRRAAMRKLRKR